MRATALHLAVPVAALGLALAGCSRTPLADGLPDGDQCTRCHGSDGNPAPPRALVAGKTTLDPEVGAHQLHLRPGFAKKQLVCEDCHVVPRTTEDEGHIDHATPEHPSDPADVRFGALATANGRQPRWERTPATCGDTYCHGATLHGGARTTPKWTFAELPEALTTLGPETCNGCHGAPPPAPHPAMTACEACHPTTASRGFELLTGGTHLDGKLDVSTGGPCGTCHGVPPATGAHRAHFADTSTSPKATYGDLRVVGDFIDGGLDDYVFGCGFCHPLDEKRHLDGVVEVELAGGGAPPRSLKGRALPGAAYDPVTQRCTNTYCHSSGQETPVSTPSPGWDSGVLLGCDGCHGNPPRYATGDAGSPTANTHLEMSDDGFEFGHFGGLPGPWHTSNHGRTAQDLGAGAITCQTCHYATVNPQDTGPSGFYWLNTTGAYTLDGGALGFRCGECHTGASLTAPMGAGRVLPRRHVDGERDVVFDPRTRLPAAYTGGVSVKPTTPYWVKTSSGMKAHDLADAGWVPATKTCTNVSCHLQQTRVQWGASPVGWATCNDCHQY